LREPFVVQAMVVLVSVRTKYRYPVPLTVAVLRQLRVKIHLAEDTSNVKMKRKKIRPNKRENL
jgi:hypothetical protein